MILKFVALTTLVALAKCEPPVEDQPNQNPDSAYYKFSYDVNDAQTGDNKVHTETRDGDVVKGQYSFDDSDGTRRIVEYTADSVNGFKATIRKEPLPELAANTLEKTPRQQFAPAPEKDAEVIQTKPAQVQTFSRAPQVQTFGSFGARVAQPNIVNVPTIQQHSFESSKQTEPAVPQTHYVKAQYTPQAKPLRRNQVTTNQVNQQPLVEVVKVQSAPGAEKVYSFSQYISGSVSGGFVSPVGARQTELVETVDVEAVPAVQTQNPVTTNFIQYSPVQNTVPVVRVYRPRANVVYERVTSPLTYTLV